MNPLLSLLSSSSPFAFQQEQEDLPENYGSFFTGWNNSPSIFGGFQRSIPTWMGNDGLFVQPQLDNSEINDRIGRMRSSYSTDPNYIRNMMPAGFEDYARDLVQKRAAEGYTTQFGADNASRGSDLSEGLFGAENYALGPVDASNFMFLGSRGARPQDNPASAQYKAQQAIQGLGGPKPNYTLPSPEGGPLSYVVATDQELQDASRAFGGRQSDYGTGALHGGLAGSMNEFSRQQAEQKAQAELADRQTRASRDFTQWALRHQNDPMVVEALGPVGTFQRPDQFSEAASAWFDKNQQSQLAYKALGNDLFPLAAPSYHLMDPSGGILNQGATQAVKNDFSSMMAWRPENQIRQQQAYGSIGDGMWGGVLDQNTYSRPDYRQITGQQQPWAQTSSVGGTQWGQGGVQGGSGGLGGLGGIPGVQTPSMGAPGMATGASYSPNPFAAMFGGQKQSQSPWGGPWGGA